jgi:Spy/CpxP family protein refolding chaperone
MSKRVILIILIVSVTINLATVITFMYFLTSEHRIERPISPRFPDRFHQEHREHLAKELDLQQQQLEELKKMQEEIQLSVREVRQELQKKRHALMAMVHDQDIDQEKVEQLITQIAALQAEHDSRIFSGVMKIKEILTKEQQRKLGMLLHGMIEPGAPLQPPHEPGHGHPPHPPAIPGEE